MAQFDFYGSDKDNLRVLEVLSARGDCAFIPDRHYPTNHPEILRKADNMSLSSIPNGRMYITGPFTSKSIHLSRLDSGSFYIDQAYSGPAFSLSLPMYKKLDGKIWHCGPGNIFHRSTYWDETISHSYKASENLKSYYRDLVKNIKSVLIRKKVGKSLWIGADAFEKLELGSALILCNGEWLDIDGRIIKSNS